MYINLILSHVFFCCCCILSSLRFIQVWLKKNVFCADNLLMKTRRAMRYVSICHQVPHSFGLVPHRSKELRKLVFVTSTEKGEWGIEWVCICLFFLFAYICQPFGFFRFFFLFCLISYHSLWIIQCQSHRCRRQVVVIFNP